MSKSDPAIDAIRKARSKISESVGHDMEKLVRHYRELQKQHPDRILRKSIETAAHEMRSTGAGR